MDSSLLDQNTVSIIRSPNKQFYFMAALDSNDLEHFSVTRGEFKVHDNALGYHPTDNMVNGWHRHANEQVSIDHVTGMTYNKLNEKKPNEGLSCLCDDTSSEFLPINMQKRFDISNSYSANLAIAQNDSLPEPPATTSSAAAAVLQVDHIEHNRIIASCLEGMSPSETHSKNDVVNAVSLAKLCDPSDVHQGLEGGCYNPPPPPSSGHGCYNPPPPSSGQGKVKQSLRKSVKKTKSLHNNCNNSRKNCGQRLSSDTDTSSNQNNVRMKSETRIENVLSSTFSVQPYSSSSSSSSNSSGQLSSRRRLSDRVRSSRSENNSDGNGDCETCGNDEDALTSGFTSAGHESTTAAIDQAWDGYQAPLYAAISDDSSEEKLDASNLLQIEWQPLTDEFMDFADFGNNSGSHGQREDENSPEVDSDTDVEELIHLINESSDALRLTRLSLNELKRNNASRQSSLHREPLATCSTNINCLRDLLDLVSQNEWTHAEVNQLSDLLKQWQNVESEFLCLTFRNDVSMISHRDSDVIIDVSQNNLPVSPIFQQTSNNSSDFDLTMIESPITPSCYYECCNKSFSNRFDVFNDNVSKLLKGSSPLHEATLAPFQFVLFIILLLIFFYLIAFNNHWTGIVGIKFDPQLRYVLGPPPL